MEVRRYVDRFLHAKAYLFGDGDDARAALVTSANLTRAGLSANLELGLVHYDQATADLAVAWFDGLWEQAEEYKEDLLGLLFPDPGLIDPHTVHMRTLLELFGDQIGQPEERSLHHVELADFQRDGLNRALSIVESHGGVIYADGVGTGKTEIGLAFIEEYALRRGNQTLVVVPAQLREYWSERIKRTDLPAQVVSFQQLASDEQLAPDAKRRGRHLTYHKDFYRLIVVDEGHTLRTPDTTWHKAMSRLLGGEHKDLVLLTATPINNGLWDLYHLVMTFAGHDRAFAHDIPSLRDLFVTAGVNARDPENLNPDILFPLVDKVSVRRDRRFIKENYPRATFPDGTPVSFPEPVMRTKRYDLDEAYPGVVSEIAGAISELKMARYRPSAYMLNEEGSRTEEKLGGLLQSAILKRFESCWKACLHTVTRMLRAHNAFLEAWDQGKVLGRDALSEAAQTDVDEAGLAEWVLETLYDDPVSDSDLLSDDDSRPTDEFDPSYQDDVTSDRNLLLKVENRLKQLRTEDDPKLALLRRLIEESQSEKIAIFSTFADTVRYLDEHLPRLVDGRKRVTVVGADTNPDERTELLARFCPETVVRPGYEPPDGEVDLLLANDVLSEGQNLQQAAAVISYDMPWNPQRVVQRNGRVIRLKSHHKKVFLTTMLPELKGLEAILKLETTIRRKVVAARPYGMETDVIEGVDEEIRSYTRRLADGDASLLDETDPTDGLHAFGGEAGLFDLSRAAREGEIERLQQLPWGIGAAFEQADGVPSVGPPGIFFTCRTKTGEVYWRHVVAKSHRRAADDDGVVAELATILRVINPGNARGVERPPIDLEDAWEVAVQSICEEHNNLVESQSSDEPVGKNQDWALNVLRDETVPLPDGGVEAEEALRAARSMAVREALGKIRTDTEGGSTTRAAAAIRIVEAVKWYGLRRVEPPPPLEPITSADVGVVCWMAVLPAPQD